MSADSGGRGVAWGEGLDSMCYYDLCEAPMSSSDTIQSLIADRTLPIAHDFSSPSTTMLIAFGGIMGEISIPAFEFFNIASQYDTKKMYVRDLRQAWYHRGLPGVADSIDGLAAHLRQSIIDQGVKTTVVIGASMGGYAAILLGCLLEAHIVHAFSPQTYIGRWLRFIRRDSRWPYQLGNVYKSRSSQPKYYDLKRVLRAEGSNRTVIHIHYCEDHRLDSGHAARMREAPGVVLHSYDTGGHAVVKYLRDNGVLATTLRTSLEG